MSIVDYGDAEVESDADEGEEGNAEDEDTDDGCDCPIGEECGRDDCNIFKGGAGKDEEDQSMNAGSPITAKGLSYVLEGGTPRDLANANQLSTQRRAHTAQLPPEPK
jgi:hypothetical protein